MNNQAPQIEPSKSELIVKLKDLINSAQTTPLEEICKTGDYKSNPDLKYPQTKGEYIVDKALTLLLSQDWVDDDPVLNEMVSVLSQLDIGVDKPEVWLELFELAEEVQ